MFLATLVYLGPDFLFALFLFFFLPSGIAGRMRGSRAALRLKVRRIANHGLDLVIVEHQGWPRWTAG